MTRNHWILSPLHVAALTAILAAQPVLFSSKASAAKANTTKKNQSSTAADSKHTEAQAKDQAQGQPQEEVAPEKPWEAGISADDQAKARALFKEGTTLLNDAEFPRAAEKLEEALNVWGHPAIHYNMAMAQVQLDRPLAARKHLLAATAFGLEGLGEQNFESAKTYIKLVEKQLTLTKITTSVEGVDVSFDGKPLFSTPGDFDGYLPAGTHALVARKDGYLTSEISEVFEPGANKALNITLYTAEELTEYRRRWPIWMPWTVFGAGVAVAAVGGILHGVGISKVSDFDSHAKNNGLFGILTTDADRDLRRDGINLQKSGVSLYGIGGAAIAAGITLIVLNKETPYLFGKPVDDSQTSTSSVASPSVTPPTQVTVVPSISKDGAGVNAEVKF